MSYSMYLLRLGLCPLPQTMNVTRHGLFVGMHKIPQFLHFGRKTVPPSFLYHVLVHRRYALCDRFLCEVLSEADFQTPGKQRVGDVEHFHDTTRDVGSFPVGMPCDPHDAARVVLGKGHVDREILVAGRLEDVRGRRCEARSCSELGGMGYDMLKGREETEPAPRRVKVD